MLNALAATHSDKQILPRRFHRGNATFDSGSRLAGGSASDSHFLLNDVNSLGDICKAGNVIFCAADFLRVIKQALHFLLRATIAKPQIIKHGVILFREPLVRVLHVLDIRAKRVHVVAHILDSSIGDRRGFSSVTAQGLDKRRAKLHHIIHVLIGGQSSGLKRRTCVSHDSAGRRTK